MPHQSQYLADGVGPAVRAVSSNDEDLGDVVLGQEVDDLVDLEAPPRGAQDGAALVVNLVHESRVEKDRRTMLIVEATEAAPARIIEG
jgi:hypothetical protein